MKLEETSLSEAHDVRDNGLEHLTNALQALEEDFRRLDQAIEGLMETLRISRPSEVAVDTTAPSSPDRSVIEFVTKEIISLHRHNEDQRKMIEWIRESIQ